MRNIDICNWDPEEYVVEEEERAELWKYSCDDLNTLAKVYNRKQELYRLLLENGSINNASDN